MFEELSNEEMIEVDGGISWAWLGVAALGVAVTAFGIAVGIAAAGVPAIVAGVGLVAGATTGVNVAVDVLTVAAAGLTGFSIYEACTN